MARPLRTEIKDDHMMARRNVC